MKWSFKFASEFCFGANLKTCRFVLYSIDNVVTGLNVVILSGLTLS